MSQALKKNWHAELSRVILFSYNASVGLTLNDANTILHSVR